MYSILYYRSIFPKEGDATVEPSSGEKTSLEVTGKAETVMPEAGKSSPLDLVSQEDNTIACITKEWEQLVVNEGPNKVYSPSCLPKPVLDQKCAICLGKNPQSQKIVVGAQNRDEGRRG